MLKYILGIKTLLDYIYDSLFSCIIMVFSCEILIHEGFSFRYFIYVFAMFLISYIARKYAINYLTVLIMHIIPCCVFLALGESYKLIIITALISIYNFVESCNYIRLGRQQRPVNDLPWAVYLVCFISYLFGVYAQNSIVKNMSYYIMILLVITYLLSVYVEGISKYIKSTEDMSGLPIASIIKTNSAIIAGIILVCIAIIALGSFIDWSALLRLLVNGIAAIVKIFAAGFMFVVNLVQRLFKNNAATSSENSTANLLVTREEYIQLSNNIILLCKFIFFVIVIIVAARFMLKAVRFLLVRRNRGTDIIEDIPYKNNVKAYKIRSAAVKKLELSNNEKIRRIYKKTVLEYRHDITLKKSDTVGQIEAKIKSVSGEEIRGITDLYENVRYGTKNADKKDIKNAKAIGK